MADRYHRAAQDGYLEVLREATKKDCNTRDGDGMTPTLWAAFEGNVDALRLLVGRGGDPEKSDYYGNTALHLASARGHMKCVTFLVNFGVNIWRQDIDQHSAQELAAMNDCTDILRYLDVVANKAETEEPKKAKKQQEEAERDVQRLAKNFKKVQLKADRQSNKKKKAQEEARKRMMTGDADSSSNAGSAASDGQAVAAMSFSDMVGVRGSNGGTVSSTGTAPPSYASAIGTVKSKVMGTMFKKNALQKISKGMPEQQPDSGFKVTDLEDGKKTVRSLSGLKRDNEIMFVAPKQSTIAEGDENGEDADVLGELTSAGFAGLSGGGGGGAGGHMFLGGGPGLSIGGDRLTQHRGSIASTVSDFQDVQGIHRDMQGLFDRPGFGSVAFRRGSMATAMLAAARQGGGSQAPDSTGDDGGDGASSDDEENGEDHDAGDGDDDYDAQAITVFLSGLGLAKYVKVFTREKIDLETLMELHEGNLMEMKLEMGPRKKILKAIKERKADLEAAADGDASIEDSKL